MAKVAREVMRERVDLARKLLGKGLRDGDIKKAIAKQEKVSPRSVERYLRRARDEAIRETGRTKRDLVAEQYASYKGIVENNSEKTSDRLKAMERIDKLLGLEAPQQVQGEVQVLADHDVTIKVVQGDGWYGDADSSERADHSPAQSNGASGSGLALPGPQQNGSVRPPLGENDPGTNGRH